MSQIQETPLSKAIDRAGGITAMARELELTSHSVIDGWRRTRVPAEHCLNIEDKWGIPCEELRPDVNWSVLRKSKAKKV